MRTIAIVGAGTAGCVIARRIVDAFQRDSSAPRVILIERGIHNAHHDDTDFMESLDPRLGAVAHVDSIVTSQREQDVYSYVQGQCIGGGGAVNGMVVSPLHTSDFELWREHYGCTQWDAQQVIEGATDLFPTTTVPESDVGAVGAALIAAGGRPATLTWNRQRTSGATLIADAVARNAIELVHANVTQVIVEDGNVQGVITDIGLINADVVVMAAGAVLTPLLLGASKLLHEQMGRQAQDHPSVFFTVARPTPFDGGMNATAIRAMGNTQLIAYESAHPTTPLFGGVSLSGLKVRSRGKVRGSLNSPRIFLNLLDEEEDRVVMRDAVRLFVRDIAPIIEQESGPVTCDEQGTMAQHLLSLNDGDLDDWLLRHVVPHSHISGTCAMGEGPHAVVSQRGNMHGLQGLYVADASVFPQIPRSNTNMVVAAVASQIARFIVEDYS